jgi:hypothetical protein
MALQRDPVRSNVAFLEHVDTQAVRRRDGQHLAMDVAAVAEHDDVGDSLPSHDIVIPLRQTPDPAAVI